MHDTGDPRPAADRNRRETADERAARAAAAAASAASQDRRGSPSRSDASRSAAARSTFGRDAVDGARAGRRSVGGLQSRAVRGAETVAEVAVRGAETMAGAAVRGAETVAEAAAHGAGVAARTAGEVVERAVASVPRWSTAPQSASAIEYHNYKVIQRESLAMGVVNASAPFLPVFIARLGGSDVEVGLLSALPALAGFIFAIPAAGYLRRRRNVVPLYATSRMLSFLAYGLTALATVVVPGPLMIPAILAIWAIATIPGTIGMVGFAVVMDGAAGPRGRYDLLSRRWSIMGLTTAISVVVIGQILDLLAFPVNYQLVFVGFSIAGLISYRYASRVRLTDQEPLPPETGTRRERLAGMIALVRSEPRFARFLVRHVVYASGIRIVAPLVPLYFVRVVLASDGWIGLIATAQSFALLLGYVVWRRQSRVRGPRFVLLSATAVAALYPAVLAFMRPEPLVAAVVAIGALFAAGTDLALFDELMKSIPSGQGLTFAAIDQSVTNAGGIVAPILGTALAGVIGIPGALMVGAAVSLLGFVLFAFEPPDPGARRSGAVGLRPLRPGSSAGRS